MTLLHVTTAFVAAVLVPALLLSLLGGSLALGVLFFMIASMHAVVLGAPLFALFWWLRRVNAFSATAGGFLVGSAGVAILLWPLRYAQPGSNSWVGVDRVQTMADGVPTLAGWIQYAIVVGMFGALGAISGLVFWLALKWFRALPERGVQASAVSERGRRPSRTAVIVPMVVFTAAASLLFLPPILTHHQAMARNCHIAWDTHPSASHTTLEVDMPDSDWPALIDAFSSFAQTHGLTLRNDSREQRGHVNVLDLNMCHDSGVRVQIDERRWTAMQVGHPATQPVLITVSGIEGSAAKVIERDLAVALAANWPGSLRRSR